MTHSNRRHPNLAVSAIAATCLILFVSGCSRFSSKSRQISRADKYFDAGSYIEAEIEYKNVLQSDHLNQHAMVRLGTIYFDDGIERQALPYLLKANEIEPDNLDLRLMLGKIAISRGDLKNAREQAEFVLAHNPSELEAPLLLAESSTKPAEIAATRQTLQQLQLKPEQRAGVLIAQGYLFAEETKLDEAEESFKSAVSANPKSGEAHYALGSLYWQKKDKDKAKEEFESAYQLAPDRSQIRLKYAEFNIQLGYGDKARTVLEKTAHDVPDYVPALVLLAELNVTEKKFPEAQALIDQILRRESANPEALMLNARIKLTKGETAKGVADLEHLTTMYPKFAPPYYLLGQGYIAQGEPNKAISALTQAVAANPNFTEPALLLAMTELRKGDFRATLGTLSKLLQTHPELIQAQLLKAEALRGQGDLNAALEIYVAQAKAHPGNPEILLYAGITLMQQGRLEQARRAFEQALVISPTYSQAVEQLIDLDLNEKKYASAIQRANDQITKDPKSATPQLFLAKVYLNQGDRDKAEAALNKAIELKPDSPTAYFLLAQLYVSEKRQDKALANLKAVIDKDPKAIGALMMTGFIHDAQKNYTASSEAYEKVIAINPRYGSALNNLAFIYSEKMNDLEKGFDLAQRARDAQPGDPHVADTLGWIVLKKGQYPWALNLLQESAGKLPAEADIQFHLGTALYMMGFEQASRAAFNRALQLNPSAADAAEIKNHLLVLDTDPASIPEAGRAAAEKSLVDRTDDPEALARLAALYEAEGHVDKAVSELNAALKLNPQNIEVMLRLVHLYEAQNETAKAMALAKDVHKLAPDDTEVSQTLARLAYRTGDFQWANSLFIEVGRAKPDEPVAQFDLANSAFSVGSVASAETAMSHSLHSGLSGPQVVEAKNFLDMCSLIDAPADAASGTPRINAILATHPDFTPAIMARALSEESKRDTQGAVRDFENVVARFPDFVPAKAHLVILYSSDPSKDQASLDLAVTAREAYPEDAQLEKALGIVVYRQKDYARATSLLKDSAQKRPTDAEIYYYLGLSESAAGNSSPGKDSLKKAIKLGLDPEKTEEARKALDETT
ncbi:MAG TPA: tetratricopeptide repeat protein [Opitutaceae bacterium]|jgi:tetratricopeptide (TPR) repeat protein|nr:tetratricopeptide repeat protein [Opitutaceae bacterium]